MEKAGDVDPDTEEIELAKALPEEMSDQNWNFKNYGTIDGRKTSRELEMERQMASFQDQIDEETLIIESRREEEYQRELREAHTTLTLIYTNCFQAFFDPPTGPFISVGDSDIPPAIPSPQPILDVPESEKKQGQEDVLAKASKRKRHNPTVDTDPARKNPKRSKAQTPAGGGKGGRGGNENLRLDEEEMNDLAGFSAK
jgi:hypothetical protein